MRRTVIEVEWFTASTALCCWGCAMAPPTDRYALRKRIVTKISRIDLYRAVLPMCPFLAPLQFDLSNM